MHFHVKQKDVWKIQLLVVETQDHKTGGGHDAQSGQDDKDQENFHRFGCWNCEGDGSEMSHELVCLIQSVFHVVSLSVLCDATYLASWILFC